MGEFHSKQDKQPLISIWYLSYNHKDLIVQTIESFLAQITSFTFKIIIHDVASTNDTQKIIKKYQAKYPHIIKTIYEEKNQ